MTLMSRWSVGLVRRVGCRLAGMAGLVVIACGLGLLSLVRPSTPYPPYAGGLVVMSIGMGLCVPALSNGVISALPRGQAGLGSGLNGAAREIGSALGVAVLGTIVTARFTARMHTGHPVHSTGLALLQGGEPARAAFADAVGVGYRVIATVVLVTGVLIGLSFHPGEE